MLRRDKLNQFKSEMDFVRFHEAVSSQIDPAKVLGVVSQPILCYCVDKVSTHLLYVGIQGAV